jgi:hypothetical protein
MKLTDEQRAVFVAAIEVAIAAPLKQGENVWAAKVKWGAIHELRGALDLCGIDWRTAKTTEDARLRANGERIAAQVREANP